MYIYNNTTYNVHIYSLHKAQPRLVSLLCGACEWPLMGPGLAGCLLRLLPPADKELHPGDGDDHVDDNSELDIAAVRSGDVRYQHPPAPRHPGQSTQRQQLCLTNRVRGLVQ